MRALLLIISIGWICRVSQAQTPARETPERTLSELTSLATSIDPEPIRRLAVAQNGRIKPLDTLARESILFITGSYARFGPTPVQMYLALSVSPQAPWAEVIEVRNTELRQQLGYLKDKRFFSAAELESSTLAGLAEPLFKKQEDHEHLSALEKDITTTYGQYSLVRQILGGDHLLQALDFSRLANDHESGASQVFADGKKYLQALMENPGLARGLAADLVQKSRQQKAPAIFEHYVGTLDTEINYNDFRPFLWASLLSLFIGILFVLDLTRQRLTRKWGYALYSVVLIPLVGGIATRVFITEFAPVTNMFGTMLWVSFGVTLFGLVLFALYGNFVVSGILLIGVSLILQLTEQIPLILSPDLDPLVAVLRSNFWLSTHVTTITISYAAFTVAMLLGNAALARLWIYSDNEKFFADYSHYAYRMVQLGCFLLSVGIVLGGIWADYSWGRFWGWDPKETWALIADLGFIALLHARFAGWADDFRFLALTPVAYLLVIMAWYGVNFILATGLHSYGFSSGGALMVAIFLTVQILFIVASAIKVRSQKKLVIPN